MILPTLMTNRLLLEPLSQEHTNDFYEMDSNPNVMRYIGQTGSAKTRQQVEDWVKRRLPIGDGLGTWAVFSKKDRTFIGCLLLIRLEDSPFIEIGYRLKEAHWGEGFATEAARKVLNYAFLDLKLKEVVAVALPEHTASRKVMEKLGLQYIENTQYYQVEVAFHRLSLNDFLTQKES